LISILNFKLIFSLKKNYMKLMRWPAYYAFSLANHACPHPSPNQQLIDRPAMLMSLSLSCTLSL
jgi:hypothetical protein